MIDTLSNYEAISPRISFLHDDRDKLRVMFRIKDKEKAKKCYQDFYQSYSIIQGAKTFIFLIKPEELYVKYGDIEAEIYNKKQ